MHTILLSIGSNIYSRTNIDKAKRMLSRYFPDICFTRDVLTISDDGSIVYPFRNILATFNTELSIEEIKDKTKVIERAIGRTPRDKARGVVVVDIDILKKDDEILRPDDYQMPYVQQLLNEVSI